MSGSVALQLTYSFSTLALLGGRLDSFCDEVRDAVLTLYPQGVVTEPFRTAVFISTRT